MKKIILFFIFILGLTFSFVSYGSGNIIKYTVPEPIPGQNCTLKTSGSGESESRTYECTQVPGFEPVFDGFKKFIKWLTAFALITAVLAFVISGMLLSMGGSSVDDTKKLIMRIIAGFLLLFLSGFVLYLIAPWVYKL